METTNRLFKGLTLAAMFAATFFNFSAHASGDPQRRADARDTSAVVVVSDLDLSNPDDAKILLSRINRAAVNVCATQSSVHVLHPARERSECEQQSYANTVAAIRKGRGIDLEAVAASSKRLGDLANISN